MGWKTPVPNQRPAVLVPASQGRPKDLGGGIAVEVVVAEVGCDPVAEVPSEGGGERSESDDGAGGVRARDETVRGSGGVRTDMSDVMKNGRRRRTVLCRTSPERWRGRGIARTLRGP